MKCKKCNTIIENGFELILKTNDGKVGIIVCDECIKDGVMFNIKRLRYIDLRKENLDVKPKDND